MYIKVFEPALKYICKKNVYLLNVTYYDSCRERLKY